MSAAREQYRDALFNLLVSSPNGINVSQGMAALNCSHRTFNTAVRDLRLFLGDWDTVNLTADPNGQGQEWTYKLVGQLDDAKEWIANRITDSVSRIRTMQSMLASFVSATSGRTTTGKKARVMERALRRLIEDLDDIEV